jgi:hypothetical protein
MMRSFGEREKCRGRAFLYIKQKCLIGLVPRLRDLKVIQLDTNPISQTCSDNLVILRTSEWFNCSTSFVRGVNNTDKLLFRSGYLEHAIAHVTRPSPSRSSGLKSRIVEEQLRKQALASCSDRASDASAQLLCAVPQRLHTPSECPRPRASSMD